MTIEYRVREVTRYIVTRYGAPQGPVVGDKVSRQIGKEFDNADDAYSVAYAMAQDEHIRLGYPKEDGRIIYPEHPASKGKPVMTAAQFKEYMIIERGKEGWETSATKADAA